MTLDEIRSKALTAADELAVVWESLEQAEHQEQFERIMASALSYLDDLESLYNLLDDYEGLEIVKLALEQELTAGYQLQELWARYEGVQSITS